MAMNKKVVVPAVALIAVLAAGGLLYFAHIHALGKADAAPAPPTVPIVAATVAQHDVPIYLTGVGTVIAYNTDVVRAQIQGQIISINSPKVRPFMPATCSRRSIRVPTRR